MTPQNLRLLAIWLGRFSFITVLLMFLALTDIYHGREADLSLEWMMVRVGFPVIMAFHIAGLIALKRLRQG